MLRVARRAVPFPSTGTVVAAVRPSRILLLLPLLSSCLLAAGPLISYDIARFGVWRWIRAHLDWLTYVASGFAFAVRGFPSLETTGPCATARNT